MKKKLRLSMIVLLSILLPLVGFIAKAQADFYAHTMDEYGNGTYTDITNPDGVWHTWSSDSATPTTDPSGGITGVNVLLYYGGTRWNLWKLTGATSSADSTYYDVLIKDSTGNNSDILRFYNPAGTGNTEVIFYSADKGGGALADTGLPASIALYNTYTNTVYEDCNGVFTYTAPDTNTFTGVSAVPEPATILLLGLGLIGLAGVRRKFRQ